MSGEHDFGGKSVIDTRLIPANAVPATRSTVFAKTELIFENNRKPKYVGILLGDCNARFNGRRIFPQLIGWTVSIVAER